MCIDSECGIYYCETLLALCKFQSLNINCFINSEKNLIDEDFQSEHLEVIKLIFQKLTESDKYTKKNNGHLNLKVRI